MPAPSNANSLSLGAPVVDATTIDTMDDVRANFYKMQEFFVGAGYPCGYAGTGMVVLNVYAEDDGEGGHLLWGGNPTDPLSPIPIIVSASGSATVIWQEEGSTVKTSGTVNFTGDGVTVTDEGDGKATVTIPGGGGGGGSTDAFGTIAVDGQSSVVADAAPDTVTFIAGAGMTITTSAGADEVTWTNNSLAFKTIAVSGQSDVVADAIDDTLTLIAGSNVTITTSAAGDSITIASTDTNTTYSAGTYLDLSGTTFNVNLTEVADYSGSATQLLGHVTGTIAFDTVGDWLKTLPSYDASKKQILTNDAGTVEWNEVDAVLNWLTGYVLGENQSIGHDADGATAWQEDGTACP